MTIAQSSVHWKRLTQGWAIPGWLFLIWKLVGEISTLSFLRGSFGPAWKFITSPTGNLIVIIFGLAWLFAVVFWPRGEAEIESEPIPHSVPLEDQIFVHIPATTTCIIGDQASTNVSFFSARDIHLTYCKVTFAIQGAEFELDSSVPLEIPAFHATQASLKRSLTPDEQERIGEGRGRILHYTGLAVFSGNLQKDFWGMVIEFL